MNNKFCRYCGTQNNYDYIYCKKCGKLLDAESDIANNPSVDAAADCNQPNPSVDDANNFNQPNPSVDAANNFNQPNPSVSPDLNTGDGYSNGNAPYGNGYPNGNPSGNAPYDNPNPYNNAPYGNEYPNGNPYNTPYGNSTYDNTPYGNGYPNGNPYNAPYGTPNAPNPNPQYTPIPDSIDGVNTEDVAIFLGNDSPKYLPVFAGIETKTRSSVNLLVLLLSALVSPFFAAFWFMHKRMNKLGLFIFLVLAAFEFGILIAAFSVMKDTFASIVMTSDVEQMMTVMLNEIESSQLLSALSSVSQMVSIAVAVFSGIFANKWYKNHVISTIKSITAENEEGYKRALVEKGGTKNALWVTLLVITAVTMFVLTIVYTAIMVSALI